TQRSTPLPTPAPSRRVVQPCCFVVLHATPAAPVPVIWIVTWVAGAIAPASTSTRWEPGEALSTSGTGSEVTWSVSMTRTGEPVAPATETVMVSTQVPTGSEVASRDHRNQALPIPLVVASVVQARWRVADHVADDAPVPLRWMRTESG